LSASLKRLDRGISGNSGGEKDYSGERKTGFKKERCKRDEKKKKTGRFHLRKRSKHTNKPAKLKDDKNGRVKLLTDAIGNGSTNHVKGLLEKKLAAERPLGRE